MSLVTSSTLETLVAQNNELLSAVYILLLFCVGVTAACFVIFLLYKFLRLFF